MADHRRPQPDDPEFDPSPGRTLRLRDFDPLEHQRLIVNPFLAVLGLMGLAWIALNLFSSLWPAWPLLCGLLAFLPRLIQYHCLDCGQTGAYSRRRDHACSALLARQHARDRRWFPFPSSSVQLAIWAWFLGAVGLFLAVLAWT